MWLSKNKDFVDENHGHVLMDDLRVITNAEVSKGPNFREAMSINWNNCKREIEFKLKHRANNFNKPQSNDGRVCWMEKKDSPRNKYS